MKRKWLIRAIAYLAVLAGAGIALRQYVFVPAPLNVLLVTFDTTRADHLGCYGYSGALTPALDALAARGTLFERAYAPAPLTLPSHASMLTGLYPPEHGLHANGQNQLADGIPTLAEILSNAGYQTGAFVGAFVLDSKFGLDRGFGTYNDELGDAQGHGASDASHRWRDGQQVVDAALAWLKGRRQQPFFCWVHLYDAHYPYDPHRDVFLRQFDGRPYDAEIAYIDLQLKRLTKFLNHEGHEKNTLIVVAGDHGEGLGEHGEKTHSMMLYNSTMRVPLIVWNPASVAPGARVAAPVSLVDMFPTILECVGQIVPGRISGRSFSQALNGQNIDPRMCYGETEQPFFEAGWSPLWSITTANWKYIRTPRTELYDLARDPGETHNLATDQPARVRAMDLELTELLRGMKSNQAPAAKLSPTEERALTSLGYAGAIAKPAQVGIPRPLHDIKDEIESFDDEEDALALMDEGNYAQASRILQKVIARSPDYAKAQGNLGICLAEAGKFDAAIVHYRRALELEPESDRAETALGMALAAQGKTLEAASHFSSAIKLNANSADANFQLAEALCKLGKQSEAMPLLQTALRINPEFLQARLSFSRILTESGDLDEALAQVDSSLQAAPGAVELLTQRGHVLSRLGRLAEAINCYKEVLQLHPRDFAVNQGIAQALQKQGRDRDAADHFAMALQIRPADAGVLTEYALLLATSSDVSVREGARAVRLAERACETTAYQNVPALDAFAAACAETGRWEDAVKTAESALKLAEEAGDKLASGTLRARLNHYRNKRPFRRPD